MHKLAPALSVNIFNFVHKNYRIYLIKFKTLWCTVFNIGLFCCMCCIIFKNRTKLGPLLQVAKLSVYNLSNKQVFYTGMVCVVFNPRDPWINIVVHWVHYTDLCLCNVLSPEWTLSSFILINFFCIFFSCK